jgi:hypothetical protein
MSNAVLCIGAPPIARNMHPPAWLRKPSLGLYVKITVTKRTRANV